MRCPDNFVFSHSEHVIASLEQASKQSNTCYDRVNSWLYGAAISGERSGTPGQPFPQDIEMRDRAYDIMSNLPFGSVGHKFYKQLNEAAKSRIERDTIDDEEFIDD